MTHHDEFIEFIRSRCASPGCHNLLRPSPFPRACSGICNMIWLIADAGIVVSRHLQEVARELGPALAAFALSVRQAAEHAAHLFEFVLLPPKRTGPPPLCIDGHAYRNRTRRRTRRNR